MSHTAQILRQTQTSFPRGIYYNNNTTLLRAFLFPWTDICLWEMNDIYSLAENCSLRLSLTWPLRSTAIRCLQFSDILSCSSKQLSDWNPFIRLFWENSPGGPWFSVLLMSLLLSWAGGITETGLINGFKGCSSSFWSSSSREMWCSIWCRVSEVGFRRACIGLMLTALPLGFFVVVEQLDVAGGGFCFFFFWNWI